MGAIVRSRARYVIEGEKCTGFFFRAGEIKAKEGLFRTGGEKAG